MEFSLVFSLTSRVSTPLFMWWGSVSALNVLDVGCSYESLTGSPMSAAATLVRLQTSGPNVHTQNVRIGCEHSFVSPQHEAQS
jgi:hypothetical protein